MRQMTHFNIMDIQKNELLYFFKENYIVITYLYSNQWNLKKRKFVCEIITSLFTLRV